MALTATIHRFEVTLSDVDRGAYETLDLRVARHPSESTRYLFSRTLAYALCLEEGLAFSKGGLSSADEAPLIITRPDGVLTHWIDIGIPSAERLHKASKAAEHVWVFTYADLAAIHRETLGKTIHRRERILVHTLPKPVLDLLDRALGRQMRMDVVRSDGHLYVTVGGEQADGPLVVFSP